MRFQRIARANCCLLDRGCSEPSAKRWVHGFAASGSEWCAMFARRTSACGSFENPVFARGRKSQGLLSLNSRELEFACWRIALASHGCSMASWHWISLRELIVKLAEYPALRAGMNAKRQLHENFPNEPSYPAHCAGSLASAREALRKI